MIEIYAVLVVALVTAGAALGILGVVSLGIRREEAAHTFTTKMAERGNHTIWAARAITGLHSRS